MLAETERLAYACLLVLSGGESSSSSLSSPSSERDRFLPRPRQVISGYSHCLQRFAHCLQKRGTDTVSNVLHEFQKENTHWHVLLCRSPTRGRHWIFRRRQKRHASLARNTGRLRPNSGKVKADSSALLVSFEDEDEDEDAAGAPVEDDGREDSDERGLDAAE